jgi:heat shock protein HslJ
MKTKAIALVLVLATIVFTSALTLAQKSASPLSGTSWQLVKFQAPDESSHAPSDRSKYTITFGSNGRVTARVDCNNASSTWRVNAKNQLEFGSWKRSSHKCAAQSLHDKIVTEGGTVRNFEIKNERLYLWGMAAGGYYELEPMTAKR